MRQLFRALALFVVPFALLAAAFALVVHGDSMPPSLSGLKPYGPYLVFAVGVALAAAFNRGRAVLALLVLVGAYIAQQVWLAQSLETQQARAIFAALVVLVPFNLALLALLPERGLFNLHGLGRLAVLGAQVLLVGWAMTAGAAEIVDWGYRPIIEPEFPWSYFE